MRAKELITLWTLAMAIIALTECRCAETTPLSGEAALHAVAEFRARAWTGPGSAPLGYVCFIPGRFPGRERPPVVLFLNGAGENGIDGVRQISNNFGIQVWEMRQSFPFIAIAPQCQRGSWSPECPDAVAAMQILDAVIDEVGGDRDRVFLTGVSSGGDGAWEVGSAYADRFAGVVPLCGEGGADLRRLARARVPVWDFYNELDTANIVRANRSIRQQLIERGESPAFTAYKDVGHDCWNRAYRTTALYRWMLSQNRGQNRVEPTFHYWRPDQLAADWKREGNAEWSVESSSHDREPATPGKSGRVAEEGANELRGKVLAAVETSETNAAESSARQVPLRRGDWSQLVSSFAGQAIELHGDVWLNRSAECRVALMSESGVQLLVSIVPHEDGTGGIVDGTGNWLARLDPSAQRALHVEGWNDVRARLSEGRLTLTLNGWPAADVAVSAEEPAPPSWRCALIAPDDGTEVAWRFVRTRVLDP